MWDAGRCLCSALREGRQLGRLFLEVSYWKLLVHDAGENIEWKLIEFLRDLSTRLVLIS